MLSDRMGLGVLNKAKAAILAPFALAFPLFEILPTLLANASSFAYVGAILNT